MTIREFWRCVMVGLRDSPDPPPRWLCATWLVLMSWWWVPAVLVRRDWRPWR